jgi:hypothetical protein
MLALLLALGAAQDLTPETWEKWHAAIIPAREELAWREIPWRPALWEAVVEAQAADKPILLWAMNGHPLACT